MQTRLELYQLVAPLAGLGIWERNLATGSTYMNMIVRQILEVEPDYQPAPGAVLQFYKNPDLIRSLLNDVIATGLPQQIQTELTTAKGNKKWVKLRMNSRSENGITELIYGTIEDITRDVELRMLLQERQEQFIQAFDHAPIGMALVSLEGAWMKVNASLCSLLGYSEQELIHHTFQEITYPDDLQADLEQMRQLLRGEITGYSMEKRYYHKDGRIIWALLNVSVVKNEDGIPIYFVSQIKDISERKKSLEIIKAQNERLLNFAHIVSHNLRSHAGNIHMLTNMINSETDEKEKTILTGMLMENAESLLNTLTELNEIVTINDNGKAHRQTVNLSQEIGRAINILSASIKNSGAEVNVNVNENLTVHFNTAYLESIFVNLISNSLKYRHPDRSPVITITAEQCPDKVLIKVADNGLGLDLELHGHKLFGMYKVFHRHKDARGMGLFLVKNQVETMGGSISAESVPGEGMTFLIEIKP